MVQRSRLCLIANIKKWLNRKSHVQELSDMLLKIDKGALPKKNNRVKLPETLSIRLFLQ